MTRILVVGSLNMDLMAMTPRLPRAGETVVGTRLLKSAGGKGANQALAAARLGGDVAMIGRVGSDEYGDAMRAGLASSGCDVGGVRRLEGESGVALIAVAENGDNCITVIPGANGKFMPADLEPEGDAFRAAQAVLLQLEIPLATVTAAAQMARHGGAQVILDPAPAPEAMPAALMEAVDVLTPNESEAAWLAGRRPERLEDEDAVAIAGILQSRGPTCVVIKLGARGCLLRDGQETTWIPAPTVTVRDTTGAGDVFNAAFAVAVTEGSGHADACRFAAAAAALSVSRFGAQASVPSRQELGSFMTTGAHSIRGRAS